MKNRLKDLANIPKYGYINQALSKISKLALVGYKYSAHTVRFVGNAPLNNSGAHSHA